MRVVSIDVVFGFQLGGIVQIVSIDVVFGFQKGFYELCKLYLWMLCLDFKELCKLYPLILCLDFKKGVPLAISTLTRSPRMSRPFSS